MDGLEELKSPRECMDGLEELKSPKGEAGLRYGWIQETIASFFSQYCSTAVFFYPLGLGEGELDATCPHSSPGGKTVLSGGTCAFLRNLYRAGTACPGPPQWSRIY